MKIGVYGLVAVVFLLPLVADAQVVVSEIMYDYPGTEGSGDHDWVEVFNAGSSAVDLTGYRFFEASTNHTIKAVQGGASLSSGSYAIIANNPTQFLSDNTGFSGQLFDSTFNLSSSGEEIGIRLADGTDVDGPFTYVPQDDATNQGGSLQRTSASSQTFTAGTPSPGTGSLTTDTNTIATTSATSTNTVAATSSASAPQDVTSYVPPPPVPVFADAGSDRTVIVGADVEFDGSAYDRSQLEIEGPVRFMWNFGDGTTAEGESVLHHYVYPGRYLLVLAIAENKSAGEDSVVITAEPAKLALAWETDGSVEIRNDAGRTIDLSHWIVSSMHHDFFLPDETRILTGATLRIATTTLRFVAGPDATLRYPNGVIAFTASTSSVAAPAPAPAQMPIVHASASRANPAPQIIKTPEVPADETAVAPSAVATSQSASAATPSPNAERLLALAAIALVGGFAVFLAL